MLRLCKHRQIIVGHTLTVRLLIGESVLDTGGIRGSAHLHARERAMPLLRYWLGDRAIRTSQPCACGRTLRQLELTRGRADDYVVLPDGERMYAGTFIGMAIGTPGVAECMVRQGANGRITVFLVPDPRAGRSFTELAEAGRRWLYQSAGRGFDVEFAPADALELTPGGKGRFVVSAYRPA